MDEDDIIWFDNGQKKRVRKGCIVGHLASPIVELDCEFLLNTDPVMFKGCTRHRRLKKKIDAEKNVKLIKDVTKDPISLIQNWVREEEVSLRRKSVLKSSIENLVIHSFHFKRPHYVADEMYKKVLFAKVRQLVDRAKTIIDELTPELTEMLQVEKIKDKVCFKNIEEGNYVKYRGLSAEPDICFFQDSPDSHILFSTNLFLCALDKMQSRFNMVMYSKLADAKDKYEGLSMYKVLSTLITTFEELRTKCGNDFYELMNAYESMIIGWAIACEDLGCTELFENAVEDMLEVLNSYNINPNVLERLIPPDRSDNVTKMYVELSGIVKAFGYPTLDPYQTLAQIIQYGTKENSEIDMELIEKLEGLARRELCVNYYRKHGRTPKVTHCPEELKMLLRGKLPAINLNREYLLWSRVRFGKVFEYDYSPDQSELIKDSAAAVNESSWAKMYDPCAFRNNYGKDPPPSADSLHPTRILLAYLNSTPDEVKKLITDRDNGILDKEDHICVLCLKECEINIKGRSFTKQTPKQRLVQVSMEHNIAEFIFPLVPEQSMIDSEIKNVRRHLQQVKNMQANAQFVNLDLKKWCLHQRHASNEYLGKMYDELFGMKTLFTQSHLFFNGCSILPNHRLVPPNYDMYGKPLEGPLFTTSFVGGMEGMQQKKWTHGAIILIKYVMEQCNLKGEIMGQGDNQVILLHFSRDDTAADDKRRAFVNTLELNFRRIGHRLKKRETWYSKNLHEYSKQRMFKGASVSYAIKKSTKVIPDINDGLFSIPSSLSTINTITEAIARADHDPDIAFIMNSINISNYLCRKGLLRQDAPVEEVLFMLNWPIDFGGINVSTYDSHTIRGNDDKITMWLSILQVMKEVNRTVHDLCMSRWVMAPDITAQTAIDRRNLYEDIHSLNVAPHPSAEMIIKDKVKEFLQGPDVTNPSIRILYDSDYSASYESVVSEVDKIRPVFPPLAHELLKNSNAGLFIGLQSKLTHSKTLEKIVDQEASTSLIDLIHDKNEAMIASVKRRRRQDRTIVNTQLLTSECITDQANRLREASWNVDLVGVTKSPWSHQCIVKSVDQCSQEELNSGITVRVSGEALDQPLLCQKMYGPMRHFVGSRTKEKVKAPATIAFSVNSTSTRSVKKLGKAKAWLKRIGDENTVKLCDKLISEKRALIDMPEEDWDKIEDALTPSVSGNLFHRFKSAIDSDVAMVNCLPSVTGHFEYSSNSMKALTAGGKDYPIFYQYIYTACTTSLAMKARETGHLEPQYMILFRNCSCMSEVPNPSLKMQNPSNYQVNAPIAYPDGGFLVPLRGLDELKRMSSFIIGKSIGRNIDENYRLSHEQGDITLSSSDYKKEAISINDLRLLDFRTVIASALISSSHCRALYKRGKEMLIALSEDRSFLYLAELILEADLVPCLLQMAGRASNEHSGVCSIFGISSFISRSIVALVNNVFANLNDLHLMRFGSDDFSDWITFFDFFVHVATLEPGIASHPVINSLRKNLRFNRNLSRLIRDSGIDIKYTNEEPDTIITEWKSCDRGTDISVGYRIVYVGTRMLPVERFPMAEITNYHAQRAISRGGVLKVPQLSFLARPLGSISSAGNKALETLLATGTYWALFEKEEGNIYCLAEGSGSIYVVLGLAFPKLKMGYNTWMRPDISHRDLATDVCVPAWADLRLDPSRQITPNPLIRGETDILSATFLRKATTMMNEFQPSLITMDAESTVESSNIQFLEGLIIPLAKIFKSCIFLVKMFHLKPVVFDILTNLLLQLESHMWTLYKPISSNPVGCEVYLVLCPKQYCTQQLLDCQQLQPDIVNYLGSTHHLNEVCTNVYLSVAQQVNSVLRDIFPTRQLDIPHTYSHLQEGRFCSLLCPRFLDELIYQIDMLHSNHHDMLCHIATRSKGINAQIHSMIHDLVFLFRYHSNPDSFYNLCYSLTIHGITTDIAAARRDGRGYIELTDVGKGDIWGTWRDGRMYIRECGKLEAGCNCEPPKRFWTWDPQGRTNPHFMLSWQVFSDMVRLRMSTWEHYHKFRSELQGMDEEVSVDRLCNAPRPQEEVELEELNLLG